MSKYSNKKLDSDYMYFSQNYIFQLFDDFTLAWSVLPNFYI
jgi:hypothetical protein